MKKKIWLSIMLTLFTWGAMAQNNEFMKKCQEGSKSQSIAVAGEDNWYFLRSELRFLSVGEFWGDKAQQTSMASNKDQRDPLQAIVEYKKELEKAGIKLLLVPIPPKAVIYPDKLDKKLTARRYDEQLQTFYRILGTQGVEVLDLTETLQKARNTLTEPLYCMGDSHLSGEGCRVVAESIAKKIKARGKGKYKIQSSKISMTGDLYKTAGHTAEQRTIYAVSGDKTQDDKAAELILMGDSHTLVFDVGGDLFAQHAGIASLLAANLKMPIDVVGVRGSGATPARINLYRKSKQDTQYLKKKKTLVWCFASREFTEANAWNAKVPIK